jgi:hypothetical protein
MTKNVLLTVGSHGETEASQSRADYRFLKKAPGSSYVTTEGCLPPHEEGSKKGCHTQVGHLDIRLDTIEKPT